MKTEQLLPNGRTELYGIIGNPVSHSLSPTMQTAAFHSAGVNAVYLPFAISEIRPDELRQAFKLAGVKGFNVTVPHKSAIISCLDEVAPQAKFLNSVNTVKIEDGNWIGHSTDGAGFAAGAENLFGGPEQMIGQSVQLLGAGGSASAVAYALLECGAGSLKIYNRTESKAALLVERLKEHFPAADISCGLYREPFGLLVNTTSVGMSGSGLPCDTSLVGLAGAVSDIIYSPPKSPLLAKAEDLGKNFQNGLPMLLHQGALAFEIWTGQPAPIGVMRLILEQSIARTALK